MNIKRPLCKYCSCPMSIDKIDHYDVWYTCGCDGYLKEKQLIEEIDNLRKKLMHKETELTRHQDTSDYNRALQKLKDEIDKIELKYNE